VLRPVRDHGMVDRPRPEARVVRAVLGPPYALTPHASHSRR